MEVLNAYSCSTQAADLQLCHPEILTNAVRVPETKREAPEVPSRVPR